MSFIEFSLNLLGIFVIIIATIYMCFGETAFIHTNNTNILKTNSSYYITNFKEDSDSISFTIDIKKNL